MRGAPPPPLLYFHAVSGKFGQIAGWHPTPYVGNPLFAPGNMDILP